MRKLFAIFILCAFLLLVQLNNSVYADDGVGEISINYTFTNISFPSTLKQDEVGVFQFTVTPEAPFDIITRYDCAMNAVFSDAQSTPALQGSGSVNGVYVNVSQMNNQFASLQHENVSASGTYTLYLKNSGEIQTSKDNNININYRFYCSGTSTPWYTVTIVNPCTGNTTCGECGNPACPVNNPTPTQTPQNNDTTSSNTTTNSNTSNTQSAQNDQSAQNSSDETEKSSETLILGEENNENLTDLNDEKDSNLLNFNWNEQNLGFKIGIITSLVLIFGGSVTGVFLLIKKFLLSRKV